MSRYDNNKTQWTTLNCLHLIELLFVHDAIEREVHERHSVRILLNVKYREIRLKTICIRARHCKEIRSASSPPQAFSNDVNLSCCSMMLLNCCSSAKLTVLCLLEYKSSRQRASSSWIASFWLGRSIATPVARSTNITPCEPTIETKESASSLAASTDAYNPCPGGGAGGGSGEHHAPTTAAARPPDETFAKVQRSRLWWDVALKSACFQDVQNQSSN